MTTTHLLYFKKHLFQGKLKVFQHSCHGSLECFLTLSRRRSLSYRNQSTDLLRKSMDWFLYDNGLRLERIKCFLINQAQITIPMIPMFLCSCAEKKNKKKRADPCAFEVFQQLQKVQVEQSAHIKCVRYTLYINIFPFVSLVLF